MGAAFEVYNIMGHGFLEEVYQDCLELELRARDIPFQHQPELPLFYKGQRLSRYYRPDLYVWDGIVVELKAVRELAEEHRAQLINYLKAAKKRIGYLINFGSAKELQWERFIVDV